MAKRMRAIQFSLINGPRGVLKRSHQAFVKMNSCFERFVRIRARDAGLAVIRKVYGH
jgi:hypothetical protein